MPRGWNVGELSDDSEEPCINADEVHLGSVPSSGGGGSGGSSVPYIGYFSVVNDAVSAGNSSDPMTSGGGSVGNNSITNNGITSGAAAILTIPPYENGNCPEGFVKDSNDNCVQVQDPCNDIKTQINATGFKGKIDFLKTKTGLKKETGFAQNKDGKFDPLAVSSNGHQLSMPSGPNRIGYLHTHLNNYLSGKYDKDGNPEEIQPIRILSSTDVNTFLIMVKNAKSTGYPTSTIFGTMVSSAGIYTIRFTGNTSSINNVKTDYSREELRELSKVFRDKYVGKWGKERGLLKYLKHKIGVMGISLYKIKASGRIRPLTLVGTKEKLERGDCE